MSNDLILFCFAIYMAYKITRDLYYAYFMERYFKVMRKWLKQQYGVDAQPDELLKNPPTWMDN